MTSARLGRLDEVNQENAIPAIGTAPRRVAGMPA